MIRRFLRNLLNPPRHFVMSIDGVLVPVPWWVGPRTINALEG